MIRTKEEFKQEYSRLSKEMFDREVEQLDNYDKAAVMAKLVTEQAKLLRDENGKRDEGQKKVYYFSMEFLIGKLMENYLINLGIRDIAAEGMSEFGTNIEDIFECEPDPGLGNGGLGRLAACFLDSMAALGIWGDGMGLRYKFGLFKQKIESGYQIELPDAWLDEGYVWETAKPSEAVFVRFGGTVDRILKDGEMEYIHKDYDTIRAVPYDVPIIGAGGKAINTLHLWDAQPVHDSIDMHAFNEGRYSDAMAERSKIEAITSILYPDDTNGIGKQLRLRQEYFLVAAGIGMIFDNYKSKYGDNEWDKMPERIQIHINDTHPTMCIPEMMRVFLDEIGLKWDDAWEIVKGVVSFTNHTVLPEALEKWNIPHFQQLLPRIYMIIDEINRRWQKSLPATGDNWQELSRNTSALWDNEVKMANLSVIGSHSVNGVSALHSDILTKTVFKEFYELSPEKFNNKTNGISHRRFMIQANPGLARLIDSRIGTGWQSNFEEIRQIGAFKDDHGFLDELAKVKRENKLRLAKYISDYMEIDVDPDSVFDVQVKRIHAYKRQLLNGFKILDLYNRLKGKSEPAYQQPYIHICRQSRTGLRICQGSYQVHQQPGRHDQLGSCNQQEDQSRVHGELPRIERPAHLSGSGRERADFDSGQRSQRNGQHEVHDERCGHARNHGRCERRDQPACRHGQYLHIRIFLGRGGQFLQTRRLLGSAVHRQ